MESLAEPGTHAVQFYECEHWLHQAIARFFAGACRTGAPAVMVARRATFDGVVDCLRHDGDPVLADGANRIRFVDAHDMLGRMMAGRRLDPERTASTFTDMLARTGAGDGVPTWIYGEMVDILCQQDNRGAAIALEEHWNTVAGPGFVVMCAYDLSRFDADAHGDAFRAVCHAHTHVAQQRARAQHGMTPVAPFAPVALAVPIVYVVDDDESMRRSLARLIGSVDVPVETFVSAEEFLGAVDRDAPGCLVLDVQLGGMSGTDLLSLMNDTGWRMPVIAMSGLHDDRMEATALALGARAFLHKPFDADALFAAIERAQD